MNVRRGRPACLGQGKSNPRQVGQGVRALSRVPFAAAGLVRWLAILPAAREREGRQVSRAAEAEKRWENTQSEGMNDRLEGNASLVRVPLGSFLGDQPEILSLVGPTQMT